MLSREISENAERACFDLSQSSRANNRSDPMPILLYRGFTWSECTLPIWFTIESHATPAISLPNLTMKHFSPFLDATLTHFLLIDFMSETVSNRMVLKVYGVNVIDFILMFSPHLCEDETKGF